MDTQKTSPRAGGAAPRFKARTVAVVFGAIGALLFPLVSSAVGGAPVITAPSEGGYVSGFSAVTIRGTAAPGDTATVVDAVAGTLGAGTANGDGAWAVSATLGEGRHTITATASDANGTTSPPSAPVTFEVDATRPAVAIDSPEDGHAFGAGEPLVIEGSASDERVVHAIRLEYWTLGKLAQEKNADCDDCGTAGALSWSHNPTLNPGQYELRAYSFDAAGNRSASYAKTTFVVSGLGQTGLVAPPLPDLGGGEVPEIPTLLEPDQGDLVPGEREPTEFSGTTEPGSTVEIKEEVAGLGTIGTAVDEDEDGRWSVEVTLPTGTYGVRTQATDEDGNLSPLSDLIVFEVDAELPSLSHITEDGTIFLPTQDVVLEGTALDDRATFAVVLEYWQGDQRVRHEIAECLTCGEPEAAWEARPDALKPGYYYVKVQAIDEAGQRSTVQVLTFTKLGL